MRKFINKMQDLSKKAAELKQTIESVPGKAAEMRQAVVMSATELQQIRTDVQSNLQGLRATTEDRLLQAMREINDATYIFEEAGYELTGWDLDLTLTQRLSVQLRKFVEVDSETLRKLLAKQTSETIKAVISGILKAEETAANVELTHLQLDGVVIHVGAIPLVRMCWRSDTLQEGSVLETAVAQPVAPASTSALAATPAFGSFFEPRAAAASPTPSPQPVNVVIPLQVQEVASTPQSVAGPSGSSSASALDRFKKMPDLGKKY